MPSVVAVEQTPILEWENSKIYDGVPVLSGGYLALRPCQQVDPRSLLTPEHLWWTLPPQVDAEKLLCGWSVTSDRRFLVRQPVRVVRRMMMINPWSYAFILDSLGFESRASLKVFTSIYTGEKSDVEKRQPPAEQVQPREIPKADTVASP